MGIIEYFSWLAGWLAPTIVAASRASTTRASTTRPIQVVLAIARRLASGLVAVVYVALAEPKSISTDIHQLQLKMTKTTTTTTNSRWTPLSCPPYFKPIGVMTTTTFPALVLQAANQHCHVQWERADSTNNKQHQTFAATQQQQQQMPTQSLGI